MLTPHALVHGARAAVLLAMSVARTAALRPRAARSRCARADLATRLAHVRALLQEVTPLVDGHNDLPWAMREFAARRSTSSRTISRAPRRATPTSNACAPVALGGSSGRCTCPARCAIPATRACSSNRSTSRAAPSRATPNDFAWALTAQAVRDVHRTGRIGSLLGMEGGHAIENSLGALRAYYDLGARYMTLTHNVTLDWADAAGDVHNTADSPRSARKSCAR
jgi:membrane dipeptidase